MRHFLLGIIVFLIGLPCSSVHGQAYQRVDDHVDDFRVFGKNTLSLSLFPLIERGFELNYDRKIVNKHWIKISPAYYRHQNWRPDNLMLLEGYSFKVQHKYFPYSNTKSKVGLFLSYGPDFQHFDLTTPRGNVKFNKYGLECVIGLRKLFYDVFFFEVYGGLATNYLSIRRNEGADWREILEKHDSAWFQYGITGNYLVFGLNIGIVF
ncbi:MAG: hypothetical protein FWE63_07930 [Bacteroidales bacterium]|nr:hypothetical protein [Bacteroidales bacterium]